MQDRPGPFTLREGAAELGLSLNTLRRRIAAGQVRAERIERPQGFVWQVYLDGAAPSQDGANETVQRDRPVTVQQPPTGMAQAEAMAAYTRSILEPLVTRLAEQEAIIRDQAGTIGRLEAENAALRVTHSPVAPNLTLDPAPRPSEAPGARSWWSGRWLVVLAVIVLAIGAGWLLAWPR